MSVFTSQYYDKPEGEDYVGKMFATNRLACQAGLGAGKKSRENTRNSQKFINKIPFVLAVFDIIMYTHPQGFLQTTSRLAYWLGPAVGMASAFTTTAYLANKLRGKDDKFNYIAGACASAGVLGAWQRNPVLGFGMCVGFCKS